ncbi:MAG: hypothetical protein E7330_08535 [Clostridiales bacterium]|nr:hypothetical protein [Clostridiales bacterium]
MATFTNFATLSYSGGTTNSNTVTGELIETLSAAKTAVSDTYSARGDIAYVISIRNSGTTPFTGLTVTDDLGGYPFGGETVYPLAYAAGSLRYFINGVLQAAPDVTAGPPLVISDIDVPAMGNVLLVYEANVTPFAPPSADGSITNTATVSGGGLSTPITASETVSAAAEASLAVTKSLSPAVVAENGQLTYTFIIENSGSAPVVATDDAVLTDIFDPILDLISVTFNGVPWEEGVNYTYDETTGIFTTLPGEITVPAATFTRNADGTFTVTPGTAVLVVTGTV